MKILITGPDGQIGWELTQWLAPHGRVIGVGRSQMDLTKPEEIRETIRAVQPDLIINAAGYTAVDRAEIEPEFARSINADAVAVLGQETKRLNAVMIHYSTDYVFDGWKTQPYSPDDRPHPQSVYGRSKFEGEQALIGSGAAHLIL